MAAVPHPRKQSPHATPTGEPYALLAPHYDRLLGHFRRPFEALRDRVLKDHFGRVDLNTADDRPAGSQPPRYLDLACGTGTGCLQMAWRGWHSIGLDLSPAMIAAAREKLARVQAAPPTLLSWLAPADLFRLRRLAPPRAQALLRRPFQAEFQIADMRDFTLPATAAHGAANGLTQFDCITCQFDSINHLPRHADLTTVLQRIRKHLAPGGLALIDANSTQAIREVWPNMRPEVHRDDEAGYFTVLQGGPYEAEHKRATLTWTWFLRRTDGGYERIEERYPEIAWTPSEWRRAARQAGLKLKSLVDASRLAPGFDPGWRHAVLFHG